MTTINSNRITGLATGMDIDEMVTNMLTNEKNKIDKAEQKKQTQVWQQEIYRDVITDVKGLYDKYFSATSADYILGTKTFSTVSIKSSNSNVISAVAGAGASDINYKFKVDKMAEPAKLQSTNITKDQVLAINEEKITINGKDITIAAGSTVSDVVKSINNSFGDGQVKATYSEMTGKLTIETKETGSDSKLEFSGALFGQIGINPTDSLGQPVNEVIGSNSNITVYDKDGTTVLKQIEEKSNSFTIDNITYTVNETSTELVSMTSTKGTQHTVDKMKAFIEDYNKMVDKVYGVVTEKKIMIINHLLKLKKRKCLKKKLKDGKKRLRLEY